jgi:hypothetical protein
MGGFEPPTSHTLSECASLTALHPEARRIYEDISGGRVTAYHLLMTNIETGWAC